MSDTTTEKLVPVPAVGECIGALRAITEHKHHGELPGGLLVDLLTASAIVSVYDAVNARNRDRIASMDLLTAQDFCLRVIERVGKK